VTPEIKRSLDFLIDAIPQLRRRVFSTALDTRPPVLIWTDASFNQETMIGMGGLTALVREVDGSETWYTSEHISGAEITAKFEPGKKTYIGPYEMWYAAGALQTLGSVCKRRQIIHFIDNTSALAGLVKGYASNHDMGYITNAYHALALGIECDTYFEYVRSAANIADLPSRQRMHELTCLISRTSARMRRPRVSGNHLTRATQSALPSHRLRPWYSIA